MYLASMIKTDRFALECDLAETYHIFDMKELPVRKVALFSSGLRMNSRIKMKMSGLNYSLETILMAKAVDNLSMLVWSKTKDAQKNRNRPISICQKLFESEMDNASENMTFNSGNDFEKARRLIIDGGD